MANGNRTRTQPPGQPSARMFDTRVNVAKADREAIVRVLNRSLADSFDLYTQTKQAHWNVKGMNFWQLHELFDKLAETIEDHADTIAERITALGGEALGTARMAAANSTIPEWPSDLEDDRAFVKALVERYATHAAQLRQGIHTSHERDDPATEDMYTELVRDVEKALYFLEAHLRTGPTR